MKITLIRQDSGSGKEALSICEAGTLFNKMKTETKSGHITALRELIPMLEGTYSQYEHIDKLPYIYSAVEYTRTKEGERKMKQYNGLVQLEVKRLAGLSEMEFVKRQAALLPQTFAAFCGSCPCLLAGGEMLPTDITSLRYCPERTCADTEVSHDTG